MIPAIQTALVRTITSRLSSDLSADISIDRVSMLPYAGIRLSGFLVRDQQNDTLFYADRVRTGIDDFSFRDKHLYLKKIQFSKPVIHLYEQDEQMNFTFLIDSLGKNSNDSVKWHYSIKGLKIRDGDISLSHSVLSERKIFPTGKLHFTNLALDVNRLSEVGDTLIFEIVNFAANEDIGLKIDGLKTLGRVTNEKIAIDNLAFRTQKSLFDIGLLEIPLSREDVDGNPVSFRAEARQLVINTEEIAMFVPKFPKISQPVTFSGLVYGTLDNLKGRRITGSFGSQSYISTSFDVNGLSEGFNAFLYLDIDSFETVPGDLELLFADEGRHLPQFIQGLETIRYSGNITGFLNDLVAYGTFSSAAGVVKTDMGLKVKDNDDLVYAGLLSTENFNLRRLFGAHSNLGTLSMHMNVKGRHRAKNDYFVFLDGIIGQFQFKDYSYENITVQGLLNHQRFDGSVKMNDPFGSLNFIGKVDYSTSLPEFNFSAELKNIQLDRLNLLPQLTDGVLSVNMNINIEGNHLDDLVGNIVLSDGLLSTPNEVMDFDTLKMEAVRVNDIKELRLESPYAAGLVRGNYSFRSIGNTVRYYLHNFLPALVSGKKLQFSGSDANNFVFDVQFKSMSQPLRLFIPGLEVSDEGAFYGRFNPAEGILNLDGHLDLFNYKGVKGEGVQVQVRSNLADGISSTVRADDAMVGNFLEMPNFGLHQKANNDSLSMSLFWNNWDNTTYSGAIYSSASFKDIPNRGLVTRATVQPSTIIIADSIWNIHESLFVVYPEGISVKNFRIEHFPQFFSMDGFIDKTKEDGLAVRFNDLDLSQFLRNVSTGRMSFAGFIDGELTLKNYFRDPVLTSHLSVNDFEFNHQRMGVFSLSSKWDQQSKSVSIETRVQDEFKTRLSGDGSFFPSERRFDLALNLDSLPIGFLDPFLNKVLQNTTGTVSGRMALVGALPKPHLIGAIKANDLSFDVDLLKTHYDLTDSVAFYPYEIRFQNMALKNTRRGTGHFNGSIYHSGFFKDLQFRLRADANDMLLLDTRSHDNAYYYGTVYGNASLMVNGTTENADISITGKTTAGTRFFVPVKSTDEVGESNFIRFTDSGRSDDVSSVVLKDDDYVVDLSGVKLEMDIEATPDAEVQIIFDERIGDILKSTGNGNIQIRINRQGQIRFYGDYTIQSGEYLFSLQNLINKRFDIMQGGTVKWQGDPYNADIDIKAVYKLKALLSDLVGTTSNSVSSSTDLQRRVQVYSNLMLTGMLQQPVIKFGIELPTLEESRESLILDFIGTEEEMNRQVLSLLILNRFYTPEYMRAEQTTEDNGYNNAALLTTTEMLSSQISNWFSSISNDVDVGVAYRPGDNITSEEFELALSTQILNNRVSINGNVGYGKYEANTSKMVGDFDLDVKLNKSGTIRANAYTRSNEDYIYEASPTSQGVGISFKEEFDEVKELVRKYWNLFFTKKKDDENTDFE
ncbi:translocation/assembly module TamB domain-containing protein [Geofilum sp. OHC36d9]|uniref:translocation/assembly module TamB domain-containing protein n=1 Tax=Geofilum sp. OHC36d9 TaxID=3458413 RepID=UPI0040347E26